jgi:hypothetical protein
VKKKADKSKVVSISPAKNLPKELAEKTVLTAKQKKRDELYRDRMLSLHTTAARLTPEQQNMAAASLREGSIRKRLERLYKLLAGRLSKVLRSQSEEGLAVAIDELASSLFIQGRNREAIVELLNFATSPARKNLVKDRVAYLESVIEAIERRDNEHCDCPAENMRIEARVYVRERGTFVDLVSCLCGHKNATANLPEQIIDAERRKIAAQQALGSEAMDAHVLSGTQ